MNAAAMLAPVFVQIALTFVLLVRMGVLRVHALREKRLVVADIALGERNWPAEVVQVQNAYQNQFELPVLFFVLVALEMASGRAAESSLVLSWVFVVSRIAHAFIHVTSNNVPQRFWAYTVGFLALALLWALFAVDVLASR